jgi:putative lipoic acid-binding regulatory protein
LANLQILKRKLLLENPSLSRLQAKLDEFYTFPCSYIFKFIAPMARIDELTALFKGKPFTTRYSKNARYVSFTAEWEVASSEEVISLYRQAAEIKGVIAL